MWRRPLVLPLLLVMLIVLALPLGAQQKNAGPSSTGPGPNAVRPYAARAGAMPAQSQRFQQREAAPNADLKAELDCHISSLQQGVKPGQELSDCDRSPDRYWAAMCKVEDLAARGHFTESASILSGEAAKLAPGFQLEPLGKRLEILRKWESGGPASVEDLRMFYVDDAGYMLAEQVGPILTLCASKQIADRDKYPILAELFERRRDPKGQALALLLDASLSGSGEKGCSALVGAGDAFYELNDLVRAEKAFTEASRYPHNFRAWPKAVYNLGILERERKNYPKAIEDFEGVLASKPNDKERGGNLMQAYQNYSHSAALQISHCYEGAGDYRNALRYALLAKNRYPYYSWCGTCLDSERRSLDQRIAYLSACRHPFVIALLVIQYMWVVV